MAADGISQREIAARLGINRRTVRRMLESDEPQQYRRTPQGSIRSSRRCGSCSKTGPKSRAPRVTEILRDDQGYVGLLLVWG